MSGMLGILKRLYRVLVPVSIRTSRVVSRLKGFIYEHPFAHDAIYDSHYYASTVEGPAASSAEAISQTILLSLRPNTIVDVGCGTGALLEALRRRGCQVLGLEYSEAALQYCRSRNLDVRKFDLERDILAEERTFDVAISMEVAEHLPEKISGRYVALLARLSSVIVFTAAPPGQGGLDHVNEQPPSYWISKFQALGFAYDEELSQLWRKSWRETAVVAWWYFQNLMIFRRM
jgi:SAM-dependent methyltransferase